jgi:hypothetical protein
MWWAWPQRQARGNDRVESTYRAARDGVVSMQWVVMHGSRQMLRHCSQRTGWRWHGVGRRETMRLPMPLGWWTAHTAVWEAGEDMRVSLWHVVPPLPLWGAELTDWCVEAGACEKSTWTRR